PADEPRAMAETASGEVIVTDFHHQLRLERLPFHRPLRAPPAQSTRGMARESRRLDQRLELFQQALSLVSFQPGAKPDMIEQIGRIIKTEQQRPHNFLSRGVAETTNDTIGSPGKFHLL